VQRFAKRTAPTTLQNKALLDKGKGSLFVASGLINHFPQLQMEKDLSYKSSACTNLQANRCSSLKLI